MTTPEEIVVAMSEETAPVTVPEEIVVVMSEETELVTMPEEIVVAMSEETALVTMREGIVVPMPVPWLESEVGCKEKGRGEGKWGVVPVQLEAATAAAE